MMCTLVLTGVVGFVGLGQADAAKDPLWLPATGNETVLTDNQELVTVQAPNKEVKEMVNTYTKWYQTKAARVVDVDSEGNLKEYSGQQFANHKFMDYVKVRTHFYEWTHRYDHWGYGKAKNQESYANEKLQAFQKHIEEAVPTATVTSDKAYQAAKTDEERAAAKADYDNRVRNFNPSVLLTIEENDMKDVEISEIRSYANEVLLFAMQHTMDHPDFQKAERNAHHWKGNAKVTPVEAAPAVDTTEI